MHSLETHTQMVGVTMPNINCPRSRQQLTRRAAFLAGASLVTPDCLDASTKEHVAWQL